MLHKLTKSVNGTVHKLLSALLPFDTGVHHAHFYNVHASVKRPMQVNFLIILVDIGCRIRFCLRFYTILSTTDNADNTLLLHYAKKSCPIAPGLVDSPAGLVNSVCQLPDGQVMFLRKKLDKIQISEVL